MLVRELKAATGFVLMVALLGCGSPPIVGSDAATSEDGGGGTDTAVPPPTGARHDWDLFDAPPGQEGYFLADPQGGFFGTPIEGGDLNCDGVDDIFIGSMRAAPFGRVDAGSAHIFFSDGVIAGNLDVASAAPGTEMVAMHGANAADFFAVEAHVADFNADGCDDALIGVQNIDGPTGGRSDAGAVYLVLGRATWPAEMDFASPQEGVVRIHGASPGDRFGLWVEDVDLNDDGVLDLMVGADQVDFGGRSNNGAQYVFLGDPAWSASMVEVEIDLAMGVPAGTLTLYGIGDFDHFGCTATSADFDGDGLEDLVVSASLNRLSGSGPTGTGVGSGAVDGPPFDPRPESGAVYVLWNTGSLSGELDMSTVVPPDMLVYYGADSGDFMGEDLVAGDINGDDIDDLVLGTLGGNSVGNALPFAGEAYVMWGAASLRTEALVDLASIPAGFGTVFYGIGTNDIAGDTNIVGDINGDGYDDYAIASPQHDGAPPGEPGRFDSGRFDIFFGGPNAGVWPWPETIDLANPPADMNIITVWGADPFDLLCYSMGIADIDDDGLADPLPNAMRGGGLNNLAMSAGEGYTLSGAVLWQLVLDNAL